MLIRFLFYATLFLPFCSYSFNQATPKVVNINASYDPYLKEFYDITYSGLSYIDIVQESNNEILIKHSRDGYMGRSAPAGQEYFISRITSRVTPKAVIVGPEDTINIDASFGTNTLFGFPRSAFGAAPGGTGCSITFNTGDNFVSFVSTVHQATRYADARCFGYRHRVTQYASQGFPNSAQDIGTVELFLRFNGIENKTFGTYSGSYITNSSDTYVKFPTDEIGNEMYTYNINLKIIPNINILTVDSNSLIYKVNRENTKIVGKVNTAFTLKGAFHNSQSFDMTFTSLNNAQCSGDLCMSNPSAGTVLPYTVKILDPSTLQEKTISRNAQKVTISADKDYQLSSGLFFEFDTNKTSLSGTFNDTMTLRAELKLM
ncbi:hypothetical protein FB440_104110 [Vibrio crassostreae]|uniref:hypothetical protein n=1 Tax=Vibrio crassostreae TaxID=246167 RepID=UPI00119C817A|nr:hypothetical protein [Vibrio crassostreae]TWD40947.1 hypothetical protein FB440_104110 [Vibrio crassostreae]